MNAHTWYETRLAMLTPPPEAIKRAPSVIWTDGLAGGYGEPPPAPVTATPWHYIRSGPVYESVNTFARRVQTTPMLLFEQQRDGTLKEIKDHPALSVLRNPNGFLSKAELLWHATADTRLNGNHYWFLAGPMHGAPSEIWPLNPRDTRLIRSKTDYIAGYVTEIDGMVIPLAREEVLHFRNPGPFDKFYGLGALAAAALAAQTGRDMGEWNRTLFARDFAVPAGMVTIEGNISDSDFDRLKNDWLSSYGGGKRRTAFLRSGALAKVGFEAIGLSQSDVDFLDGIQWEAETVYRIFDCHHLRSAQYADDAKNLERMFLDAVWAWLEYVAETITDQFLTFWGPSEGTGHLVLRFEDIRPRDRALDLEESREEAKGQTLNEWREARGMTPLEGGDDILFVHVQGGEKVKFELAALPEEEPTPTPPQLLPFTGQQPPPENDSDAQKPQTAEENAAEREQAGQEYGDEVDEKTNKAVDPALIHRELKQWERFVLKRLDSGQEREFIPDHTPAYIANLLHNALDDCGGASAVKVAFQLAHDLADGKLAGLYQAGELDPELVITPESMKAIQATRLDFERDFEDLLTAAREGQIDRRTWSFRLRTLLRKYGEKAFRDGLNDGGIVLEETDPLDDEDRATFNALLADQSQYVTDFGATLYKAITDAQAAQKPSMWFNKSIDPFYKAGRLSADRNAVYEWVLGPTEESCPSCMAASGQRHRLKEWHTRGVLPQMDNLDCGGFNCKCKLVRTKEKPRGRFIDIPLKTADHSHTSSHHAVKALTAEGYAVLYVDRAEGLLKAQAHIAEAAQTAGIVFEPVSRDELHITLVYAERVDDGSLRYIGNEVMSNPEFQIYRLAGTDIEWFGEDEQRKALVLRVGNDGGDSEAMKTFQAWVYGAFKDLETSLALDMGLSEFSQPENWKPHVTLGYSQPFYVPRVDIEFDAVRFAVARDNYQNVMQVEGESHVETA